MAEKTSNGFSDLELGPLLGKTTHERKKKGSSSGSVGEPMDEPTSAISRFSPGRPGSDHHHFDKKDSNAETDKYSQAKSSVVAGKVIFACSLYAFCSVSMVLVNKSLASSYNHIMENGDLNILLVVIQAIVAVVCVEFCKMMKWVEYPPFEFRTAQQWAPVNILFCGMLFTGMASLQYNNVPMVTVFKNITNVLVAAGDKYYFGAPIEMLVMVAFGIMLLGAVFAARNDIHVTTKGLLWMWANCVTTSGYVLYMKFATKSVKLSKFGMVFYNNVLCTVFLMPVAIFNGEVNVFLNNKGLHTFDYYFKNFFAGFVGFFLNFASLNCVQVTGPSTYAIIGSLNKIPTSILGWMLFDSEITGQTWFFIGVSMAGGFLYSYAKLDFGKKKSSS